MARSFKRNVGLNGVYNGDSEFMAGESIMFSGPVDKIPAGYLVEDGAAVGRVAYATLFAAIGTTYGAGDGATTFNLPDSRGEVWRGLDMGRGVDAGRVLGSLQGDAIRKIQARIETLGLGFGVATSSAKVSGAFKLTPSGKSQTTLINSAGEYPIEFVDFDASLVVPTAGENRMRNIAKIPLIKY